MSDADSRHTVLRLQDELDRTLADLLPRGMRAALVNYPNHHNVGDPALYLGTLSALKRIGVRVTYRCEHTTYSRETLAAELRRGTEVILINGGGNLGDQYPQQLGREQVLTDFPDVRTIQLAQSIWFEEPANLNSFAELVAGHADLTLLLRDRESLAVAQRHFDVPARLCPDMVFGLGPMPRPVQVSKDIVWLRRSDRESTGDGPVAQPAEVEPVDWLGLPAEAALGGVAGVWLAGINRWLARRVREHPPLWRAHAATYSPLARRRLEFGCRLLARGRVVVSDRLHGVILALLLGIPVVAVDNRNRKVSSFVRTWFADDSVVGMAASHVEGLQMAVQLVPRRNSG